MLEILKIKNFALAEDIEINFKKGFNVIIGETGAGKSILFKSIMFVLGEKFNKDIIRSGENFVKVSAKFSSISQKTKEVLDGFGISCDDDSLILSRYLNTTGKQEIHINGEIANLSMLKNIAGTLVNFCGQHDSLNLLKKNMHINILDSVNPILLRPIKEELVEIYSKYNNILKKLDEFGGDSAGRERKLDLLTFQINEIQTVNPYVNEDSELENKIIAMKNFEKISSLIKDSITQLDNSLYSLRDCTKTIYSASKFDENIADFSSKLENNFYELEDQKESIEHYLSSLQFDEYELEKLDSRLDGIKTLKRKYGETIEEVLKFCENAINEKDKLEEADVEIEKLNNELQFIEKELTSKSDYLTNLRKQLASELEQKLKQEFADLGMKNAKFVVNFEKQNVFSSNGNDIIEFLFSANTGETLKSLNNTISGGEMSRFMLALKNIVFEFDDVNTLIFDEIDAGISGETGSKIAEKIAKISKNTQVLCVTHMQQVCSMGDNFYFVSKSVVDNKTKSNVQILYGDDIIIAISRLAGGNYSSDISIAHAKNLKNWADNYKLNLV